MPAWQTDLVGPRARHQAEHEREIGVGVGRGRTRVGAFPPGREFDRALGPGAHALRREGDLVVAALLADRDLPRRAVELGHGRVGRHRLDGDVLTRLVVRVDRSFQRVGVVGRVDGTVERRWTDLGVREVELAVTAEGAAGAYG